MAAQKVREATQSLEETTVAVQTQQAAATNEWQELKEEVPKLVDAIQNRVDNLKGSRLPPRRDVGRQMPLAMTLSLPPVGVMTVRTRSASPRSKRERTMASVV